MQYCQDKMKCILHGQLPIPAWHEQFDYDPPDHAMDTKPFNKVEFASVMKALKNNIAPG